MNTKTITKKKTTSLRIDNGLFEHIENIAKRENRSINNYIETILLNTTGYNIAPELTKEDLEAIEQSKKEAKKGLFIPYNDVMEKAKRICTK